MIPGYRLTMLIGTGQTSTVYQAVDGRGREVALKIPKPEVRRDPQRARMFATEVNHSRAVEHERIVPTYSGVAVGPEAHLAMKYFADGPLSGAELDDIPLSVALRVVADVAAAMEYVHGRGIVHQDVKPANIFAEDGRAFLGDFGVATSEAHPSDAAGSPFYMSPELYRGERGTPRSDAYSLGVVAYELLTGRRPIVGESFDELMVGHLSKLPPPIRGIRNEVPRPVAGLVDRALSKDPQLRPTAAEFRRVIEPILEAAVGPAATPEPADEVDVRRTQVLEPAGPTASVRAGRPSAMRARQEPSTFWGRVFKKKR